MAEEKYKLNALRAAADCDEGKKVFALAKKEWERKYFGAPIAVPSYSLAKRIYGDGNRVDFEAMYFRKRERLMLAELLAVFDDRYISDLEDIAAAICDEFTWVLPAHNYRAELNRFDYDVIDLFSAETAMYLSLIYYTFFDVLSEDIKYRIKTCVFDRVIRLFERDETMFLNNGTSNWVSVMTAGVGTAYLCVFPERLWPVKQRLFESCKRYLEGLGADGYCFEGRGYWGYGFGMLAVFCELFEALTGERPAFVDGLAMKNGMMYEQASDLGNGAFLPFSDGGSAGDRGASLYDIAVRACLKSLYGNDYTFTASAADAFYGDTPLSAQKAVVPQFVYALSLQKDKVLAKTTESRYYKSGEVFIYKTERYSFAAKVGNNGELHNHNDVGAFALFSGGRPIIADLGAGEYTRRYFDDATRYGEDIFVCSSASHSVPIVDGRYQSAGSEYRGKVKQVSDTSFCADIAGAYENGPDALEVEFVCKERTVDVSYTVRDKSKRKVCIRFVCVEEPKRGKGRIELGDATLVYPDGLECTIAKRVYRAHSETDETAYTIDFCGETDGDTMRFSFEIGK